MSGSHYAGSGILPGFFEPCTLLKPVNADARDGQGGYGGGYEDGEAFEAKIHKATIAPHEALLADQQTIHERYTVVIPASMALHYQDVFRRERDGQTFRVTSHSTDSAAPAVSTIQIAKVSAERWEVPE